MEQFEKETRDRVEKGISCLFRCMLFHKQTKYNVVNEEVTLL